MPALFEVFGLSSLLTRCKYMAFNLINQIFFMFFLQFNIRHSVNTDSNIHILIVLPMVI